MRKVICLDCKHHRAESAEMGYYEIECGHRSNLASTNSPTRLNIESYKLTIREINHSNQCELYEPNLLKQIADKFSGGIQYVFNLFKNR